MRVSRTLIAIALLAATWMPATAQPAGRTCHITQPAGAPLRPEVAVKVETGTARTGEAVALAWDLRTKLDPKCRSPLYLIVHMGPQVRFAGEGFIVLPPGVEAPFAIKLARDQMRVLVPLHLGASTAKGRIEVIPLKSGPLEISWDVVEVPALVAAPKTAKDFVRGKELRGGSGSRKVEVAEGQPHIVLQDRYAVEQPKRIVSHAGSGHELHDYGSHFRVLERATGLLVAERRGSDPRLSPTGRFVYAFGVPGIEPAGVDAGLIAKVDQTVLEVVDLMSGERVAEIRPNGPASDRADTIHAAHWAMGDAVLALAIGNHVDRRVSVLQPLIDRRRSDKTCIVCDVEIDLDNTMTRYPAKRDEGQLVTVENPQATLAFSDRQTTEGWRDVELAKVFAPEQFAKLPADGQQSWNIEQEVATAVETAIVNSHQVARGSSRLKLPLWDKAVFEGGGVTAKASATEATVAADAARVLRAVRTAGAVTTNSREVMSDAKSTRLVELLAEQGLALASASKVSRHAGEAIAKAMIADIPKAAALFDGADFLDCRRTAADGDPVDADGNRIDKDELERGSVDMESLAQALQFTTTGGLRIWLVSTHCMHGTGRYGYGRQFVLTQRDGAVETLHWLHARDGADRKTLGGLLGLDDGRKLVGAMSHDRYLLMATEGGGAVAVWDVVEGKLLHVSTGTGEADVPLRLALTTNLRHLVQVNMDGTLRVHPLVPGNEGVSGRFIDDEIVLFDRKGYFTGTPEGAHHVFLKFPGVPGLATLHQYREALFRPEQIRALLATGQSTAPQPRLPASPAIELRLEPGKIANDGPGLRLAASASSDSALKELRLFVDGRLTQSVPLDGRRQSVSVLLDPAPAARWITAQAVDRQGLESAPVAIALRAGGRPSPAPSRGTLHVLAVGTDTYDDPQVPPLALAGRDAKTFFEAARGTAGHYHGAVKGQLLLDEAELKSVLVERIAGITRDAGPADTIALFVAGHGLRDESGRFYLATAKTRMADLTGTSIAFDEIAALLGNSKARVVIFLDACHSGAAGGLASNDDVAKAFLDRRSAITVIAATKGRQLSEEHAQLAGGVFTRALADALVDRTRLDGNGNGAIELSELYGRLKRRVDELTNGRQTPWIARNNMVGEIPFF